MFQVNSSVSLFYPVNRTDLSVFHLTANFFFKRKIQISRYRPSKITHQFQIQDNTNWMHKGH